MKKIASLSAIAFLGLPFVSHASEQWLLEQAIPTWVSVRFVEINNKYMISSRLNPFYLRGDFDGDDKPDLALLVEERASKKIGIAIFHYSTKAPFILGAGQSRFGNGGDDFKWMDIWNVCDEGLIGRGVDEGPPPQLKGEAIWVEKSESASAVIFWDGKKYEWYQQGD